MSTEKFAVRITTSKGVFWWSGVFKETNAYRSDGYRRNPHTFGLTENPTQAIRWATLKGAIDFAQALDGDMRLYFDIERINAVQMVFSQIRGWVPYNEADLAESEAA